MTLAVVSSRAGVSIRLTFERWRRIVAQRPQFVDRQDELLAVVADPDVILRGDEGELLAARWSAQQGGRGGYLVVVYREVSRADGFVITAYPARRLPGREIIWRREQQR